MTADDERTLDPTDIAVRRPHDDGGDADGSVDRAATTVRHGIDQVADKVKGLLRSDR